jgi:hypothetical protein
MPRAPEDAGRRRSVLVPRGPGVQAGRRNGHDFTTWRTPNRQDAVEGIGVNGCLQPVLVDELAAGTAQFASAEPEPAVNYASCLRTKWGRDGQSPGALTGAVFRNTSWRGLTRSPTPRQPGQPQRREQQLSTARHACRLASPRGGFRRAGYHPRMPCRSSRYVTWLDKRSAPGRGSTTAPRPPASTPARQHGRQSPDPLKGLANQLVTPERARQHVDHLRPATSGRSATA